MSEKKVITQEDLDNHEGLSEKFAVGDTVLIPENGVINEAEKVEAEGSDESTASEEANETDDDSDNETPEGGVPVAA